MNNRPNFFSAIVQAFWTVARACAPWTVPERREKSGFARGGECWEHGDRYFSGPHAAEMLLRPGEHLLPKGDVAADFREFYDGNKLAVLPPESDSPHPTELATEKLRNDNARMLTTIKCASRVLADLVEQGPTHIYNIDGYMRARINIDGDMRARINTLRRFLRDDILAVDPAHNSAAKTTSSDKKS